MLAGAVLLVLVVGYLLVAGLVAAVLATAEGGQFSLVTAGVAALPGWLAAHQVPLSITGAPLTILPWIPTILMMLLISAVSGRLARRSQWDRPAQAVPIVLVMGLAHAACGATVALLIGSTVDVVALDAFLCCGLVAAVASTFGLARPCGLLDLARSRVRAETWSGLRAGVFALLALLVAGAVVVAVGIGFSVPVLHDRWVGSAMPGEAFGAALVSVLYLPNAVLAGWSFAAGPGLVIGKLAVQPLAMTPGPVPALPLFAVLPSTDDMWWWATVFALPVFVGVLVGWRCRHAHPRRSGRLRAVVVSGLVTALGTFVLAAMAGGRLGGGVFDPVTIRPGWLMLVTAGWIAVPAAAVACFARASGRSASSDPAEGAETGDGDPDGNDQPEEALASAEALALTVAGTSEEAGDLQDAGETELPDGMANAGEPEAAGSELRDETGEADGRELWPTEDDLSALVWNAEEIELFGDLEALLEAHDPARDPLDARGTDEPDDESR